MVVDVVIEFIGGATVRALAYVYDEDGNLVNPTISIKITIYDPDDTVQVDEASMSATDDTGIFDYYYKTDADTTEGWWRGRVVVVDGVSPNDYTSIGKFGFRIS